MVKAQSEVRRTVVESDGQIIPQKGHVDVNGLSDRGLLWCVKACHNKADHVSCVIPGM